MSDTAERLGNVLMSKGKTIAVAESCTGGLFCNTVTNIPGSSAFFLGGIIAYSNEAKTQVLGVPAEAMANHGAVSAKTALAMAFGALDHLASDIAVAITGIAGPSGGSEAKPVGTVFIAVASEENMVTQEFHFSGPRAEIKQQSVNAAIELAINFLTEE